VTRQFFRTQKNCVTIEYAIRNKWPDIKNLIVRLSPEHPDIEVRFELDGTVTAQEIEDFIQNLPKEIK
jgi:hypothetical protein